MTDIIAGREYIIHVRAGLVSDYAQVQGKRVTAVRKGLTYWDVRLVDGPLDGWSTIGDGTFPMLAEELKEPEGQPEISVEFRIEVRAHNLDLLVAKAQKYINDITSRTGVKTGPIRLENVHEADIRSRHEDPPNIAFIGEAVAKSL